MPHRYALPIYLIVVILIGGLAQWISERFHPLGLSASSIGRMVGLSDAPPSLAGHPIPPFKLQDQDDCPVTRDNLLGHVWVADFIFIQCGDTCPILNRHIVDLEHDPALNDVRFISFSADANDKPPALKRYIVRDYQTADPTRWRLLAADQQDFPNLAVDLGMAGKPDDVRDGFLAISADLYLIDANGKIAGEYDGTSDAAVKQLRDEAAKLSRGQKLIVMSRVTDQ